MEGIATLTPFIFKIGQYPGGGLSTSSDFPQVAVGGREILSALTYSNFFLWKTSFSWGTKSMTFVVLQFLDIFIGRFLECELSILAASSSAYFVIDVVTKI